MKKLNIAIIAITLVSILTSSVSAIQVGDNVEYIAPGLNLGLGVINPAAKLDVNGQVMIRGGNPQEGFVLTSDSAGLASWSALPVASNVSNADTANFAEAAVSVFHSVDSTEPGLFIDNNGYANITGMNTNLNGTELQLGLDDGIDIGSKTSQRALVHGADDVLYINYDREFEGGVNISQGAILIDDNKTVTIPNALTTHGKITAERLVPSQSPVIANKVALHQKVTVPAQRCSGAIRVDYRANYEMKKRGNVDVKLYVDGQFVDQIQYGVFWFYYEYIFYAATMSGYYYINDVETDHVIEMRLAAGNPVEYSTYQAPQMSVTCI